jgi:hypothetical protein
LVQKPLFTAPESVKRYVASIDGKKAHLVAMPTQPQAVIRASANELRRYHQAQTAESHTPEPYSPSDSYSQAYVIIMMESSASIMAIRVDDVLSCTKFLGSSTLFTQDASSLQRCCRSRMHMQVSHAILSRTRCLIRRVGM